MVETLTAATFSEQLNKTFRIQVADNCSFDIELTEVGPVRQTRRQEQFTIVFRGPRDAPFNQGTYTIEHDKIGSFDLFLVPVAIDDQGLYYNAVFNRLRD